jgi:LacI family transcriptional regulator
MVTFDELPFGVLSNRFLTVANQPAYEMGYRATELLLGRLSGDIVGPVREIVLPVEIYFGKSTARTMS